MNAETQVAVEAYKKYRKANAKAAEAEQELFSAVTQPGVDRTDYANAVIQFDAEWEATRR